MYYKYIIINHLKLSISKNKLSIDISVIPGGKRSAIPNAVLARGPNAAAAAAAVACRYGGGALATEGRFGPRDASPEPIALLRLVPCDAHRFDDG